MNIGIGHNTTSLPASGVPTSEWSGVSLPSQKTLPTTGQTFEGLNLLGAGQTKYVTNSDGVQATGLPSLFTAQAAQPQITPDTYNANSFVLTANSHLQGIGSGKVKIPEGLF